MPALTQLATVKIRLNLVDATDDPILTRIINAISDQFECLCNRTFERSPGCTEEFAADETEIQVVCYPLESVTLFELKNTEAEGWQGIVPTPDFVIRRDCVISLAAPLGTSRQRVRITYTGGYVLPGVEVKTGQIPLPESIQQACVEQIACWYLNRNKVGLVSLTEQVGTVTQYSQLDLLPSVRTALKPHIRWSV